MNDLFADIIESQPTAAAAAGPFAGVAIEQSIDRVLDYSVPKKLLAALHVGQRVRVPLGRNNRPAHGFVVRLRTARTRRPRSATGNRARRHPATGDARSPYTSRRR